MINNFVMTFGRLYSYEQYFKKILCLIPFQKQTEDCIFYSFKDAQ